MPSAGSFRSATRKTRRRTKPAAISAPSMQWCARASRDQSTCIAPKGWTPATCASSCTASVNRLRCRTRCQSSRRWVAMSTPNVPTRRRYRRVSLSGSRTFTCAMRAARKSTSMPSPSRSKSVSWPCCTALPKTDGSGIRFVRKHLQQRSVHRRAVDQEAVAGRLDQRIGGK